MLVQDMYILGVKLHDILLRKKIHYVNNKEEFDRIWQEAINEVRTLVETNAIDLYDLSSCIKDIEWGYLYNSCEGNHNHGERKE